MNRRRLLSVVTPAFGEERNLPVLYERLCKVLNSVDLDWEWVVVDDHSTDGSFAVVADIARRDSRVRAVRFARNLGSHTAITCGLHRATVLKGIVPWLWQPIYKIHQRHCRS
jgi:dolichol-phosphate mannosyltransferase